MLRAHEEQLKEAQAVPATLQELEATKAALKVLLSSQCLPGRPGGIGGQQRGTGLKQHPTLFPTEAEGPGGGSAACV